MSALARETLLQFGSTGATGKFGKFGSLAAGSPTTTKDIGDIQSLAAWLTGWSAATIASNRPALQDMNALFYVAFYQLCYLFEKGIAEWDAATTYYIGSIVNDGTGVLYKSIQDTNLNHATSDAAWWSLVAETFVPSAANALAGSVLQCVTASIGTNVACTTNIPTDNTTPLITEGDQVLAITFTPKSATSKIIVLGTACGSVAGAAYIAVADIFVDSVLAGVGWNQAFSTSGTIVSVGPFEVASPGTSPITIQMRCGANGVTWEINKVAANLFNGAKQTALTVIEIKV